MRRGISVLIIAIMLSVLALPAFAQQTPAGTPIRTEAEFQSIANGGTYYLAADITITRTTRNFVNVTVDGNGHIITLEGVGGMIGYMENTTIKNLKIDGSVLGSDANHASALSIHGGPGLTLENIEVSADLLVESKKATSYSYGGVISKIEGKSRIKNVSFSGTISIEGVIPGHVGGIVGSTFGEATLENCKNNSFIEYLGTEGKKSIGGIVGRVTNKTSIIGCESYGSITSNAEYCNDLGGIVGVSENDLTIKDTKNSASITSNGIYRNNAAGIVGYACAGRLDLDFCHNKGRISAGGLEYVGVGGMVGCVDVKTNAASIRNSTNEGEIAAAERANTLYGGGMIGLADLTSSIKIEKCANLGRIDTGLQNASCASGGMIGGVVIIKDRHVGDKVTELSMSLVDCVNMGEIKGYIGGGLIGECEEILVNEWVSISHCVNGAGVQGNEYAGGLLGIFSTENDFHIGSAKIEKCLNYGSVGAQGSAAGVLGACYFDNLEIIDSANAGSVEVKADGTSEGTHFAGGIVATGDATMLLDGCVNVAQIASNGEHGAICPDSQSAVIEKNCVYLGEQSSKVYLFGEMLLASEIYADEEDEEKGAMPPFGIAVLKALLARVKGNEGLSETIAAAESLMSVQSITRADQKSVDALCKTIYAALEKTPYSDLQGENSDNASPSEGTAMPTDSAQGSGCKGDLLSPMACSAVLMLCAILCTKRKTKYS